MVEPEPQPHPTRDVESKRMRDAASAGEESRRMGANEFPLSDSPALIRLRELRGKKQTNAGKRIPFCQIRLPWFACENSGEKSRRMRANEFPLSDSPAIPRILAVLFIGRRPGCCLIAGRAWWLPETTHLQRNARGQNVADSALWRSIRCAPVRCDAPVLWDSFRETSGAN
jgi:hypothetical protein